MTRTYSIVLLLAVVFASGCIKKKNKKAEDDDELVYDPPIELGLIVFDAEESPGNSDLFSIAPDGSSRTNISNSAAADEQFPVLSHDGTRLAFVQSGTIYHTDLQYKGRTMLGTSQFSTADYEPSHLSWSARSNFITCNDNSPEPHVYYVPTLYNEWKTLEILDGGFKRLTGQTAQHASFSPADNDIAFVRHDASSGLYTLELGNYQGDGAEQAPVVLHSSDSTIATPRISQDGLWVAFCLWNGSGYDVCLVDTNGDAFANLTNGNGSNTHPAFSFDGSQLVFASDRDGNSELYTIDVDGSNLTNITNTVGVDELHPHWH